VLPSRYDPSAPMSSATLNQVMKLTYQLAQKDGKPLGKFGPHGQHPAARSRVQQRLDRKVPRPRTAWRQGHLQQGRIPGAAAADVAGLGGHDRPVDEGTKAVTVAALNAALRVFVPRLTAGTRCCIREGWEAARTRWGYGRWLWRRLAAECQGRWRHRIRKLPRSADTP